MPPRNPIGKGFMQDWRAAHWRIDEASRGLSFYDVPQTSRSIPPPEELRRNLEAVRVKWSERDSRVDDAVRRFWPAYMTHVDNDCVSDAVGTLLHFTTSAGGVRTGRGSVKNENLHRLLKSCVDKKPR